ncbi:hypothetical protein TcWFU_006206 [Taenia crassiceps]|uniref:Uncharacterized protein n=1 Tax=Taenia crassiceps TaxID=6207 RepID=A0ABR4QEE7_9CEST
MQVKAFATTVSEGSRPPRPRKETLYLKQCSLINGSAIAQRIGLIYPFVKNYCELDTGSKSGLRPQAPRLLRCQSSAQTCCLRHTFFFYG